MATDSNLSKIASLANLIYTETEDGKNTHYRVGEFAKRVANYLSTIVSNKSLITNFEAYSSVDELPADPTDAEKVTCFIVGEGTEVKYYIYVGSGKGDDDTPDDSYKEVSAISGGTASGSSGTSSGDTSGGSTGGIVFELDTTNGLLIMAESSDITADKYACSIEPYTTPSAPTIVATGTTSDASRTVKITSATSGSVIMYTTDGSVPSATNGSVYSTQFSASASVDQAITTLVVKAVAIRNGLTSDVAEYSVKTARHVASPTITATGDDYADTTTGRTITLACSTAGSSLKYTINGGTETEYTEPFKITATSTIKVTAECSGWQSESLTKSFTVGADGMYFEVMNPISIPTDPKLIANLVKKNKADLITGVQIDCTTTAETLYGGVVFAYPKSYGKITSIKDNNNLDAWSNFETDPVVRGTYYVYYMKSAGTDQKGISYTFKL